MLYLADVDLQVTLCPQYVPLRGYPEVSNLEEGTEPAICERGRVKKSGTDPCHISYPAFFICFALIPFVYLFFQVSRDSFAFEQLINWSCLGTSIPEFVKERDKVSSKQLNLKNLNNRYLPRAR